VSKAKRDNLCIRIAYERWKQTYESIDILKKPHLMAESAYDEETQSTALEMLQSQTSELLS
jgi:hypothetical protein